MENLEKYIIEKEYDNVFLIEESFFSWIKKLGKKFWSWLTEKDFMSDDIDWNVGEKKKIQWVNTSSSSFEKIKTNKGLQYNFPITTRILDKYGDLMIIQAFNSSKTPIIIILTTNNKDIIVKLLKKEKNYETFKNKINNVKNPVMIMSVEIAKGNSDDKDYLFDDYVVKTIENNLIKKYDIIFLCERYLKEYYKMFRNEFDVNNKFPVIDGLVEWYDIDGSEHKKQEPNETDNKDNTESTDKTDDQEPNKQVAQNKDEFELRKIKFKYMDDAEKIKEFISDNKLDNDYKYIIINKIEFVEKPDNMSKLFEKVLTSKDFKNEINKISTEEENKEIKVCFSLDKTSNNNKEIINVLSNLSIEIDGTIIWEVEDTKNGLFVYSLNENIFESLDVDNLFWMLDTWFANNEQERTIFMSLIDNCIIKKTYNKNDLAKLCDNINFDVRPFINFISKDVVINDNEKEDLNFDYYYELKKIIDALISNKSTSNKYVRFS